MDMIIYSIALHGKFLFRTGEFQGLVDCERVQEILVRKFPASEGYAITRERHPATFTTARLEN